MKNNKQGYIHWLVPVSLIMLILGVLVASIMKTRLTAVITLFVVGGASGYLLFGRKKVSLLSAHVLILFFVMGFAAHIHIIHAITVFIIFYLSLALVYYSEQAILKRAG